MPGERETTAVENMPPGGEPPAEFAADTPVEEESGPIHRELERRGLQDVSPAGEEPLLDEEESTGEVDMLAAEPPDLSGEDDALVVGGDPAAVADSVATFVGEIDPPAGAEAEAAPPPAGGQEKTEILPVAEVGGEEPPPVPMLLVELPDGSSSDVEIGGDRFVIGRAPECDAVIPDRLVSRTHAVIERQGDSWLVIDQQSGNGTLLNGEKVEQAVLQDGDVIGIGDAVLTFQLPGQGAGGVVEKTMMLETARVERGTQAVASPLGRLKKNRLFLVAAGVVALILVLGIVKLATRPRGPTPEQIAAQKRIEEQKRQEAELRLAAEKFAQVKQLVKEGKWAEAKPLIDEVARVVPDDKTVVEYKKTIDREELAGRLLVQAQAQLAVDEFDQAALLLNKIPQDSLQYDTVRDLKEKLAGKRVENLLEQARQFKEAKEYDQAAQAVDDVLQSSPENEIALALREEIARLKKEQEARSKRPARRVKKPKPVKQVRSRALLDGTSLQAYLKGDVAGAIAQAPSSGLSRDALAKLRKFGKLYERGVQLARNPGQAQRAEGFLLQSLKLDQQLAGGRGKLKGDLAKLLAKVYFVKGIDAQNRKKYPDAYSAFKAALRYRPDLKQAKKRLQDLTRQARTLYETAYVYKSTDPERATKMCQTVLRMVDPTAYAYGRCKKLLKRLQAPGESMGGSDEDF